MMKVIFTYLMIGVLIVPFSIKTYYVVDYFANYVEYTTSLCENVATDLSCKGKCQLKKNIQSVSTENSEKPQQSLNHTIEIASFILPNTTVVKSESVAIDRLKHYFNYSEHYSFLIAEKHCPPPEIMG